MQFYIVHTSEPHVWRKETQPVEVVAIYKLDLGYSVYRMAYWVAVTEHDTPLSLTEKKYQMHLSHNFLRATLALNCVGSFSVGGLAGYP